MIEQVPPHLRELAEAVLVEAAADPRMLAVVAGGSVATGTSDEYSEATTDRDDCLRALKASIDLYRKVRDTSGVQVVRRTAAEEAVVDFLG